jgi:phosphate transport system substrate-binding protein
MPLPLGLLLATTLAVGAIGCGRSSESSQGGGSDGGKSNLSGRIQADGSSTVGPLTTYAAEQFQKRNPKVRVTVGISGTGGGFERFCNGETDLSDASRPIKDEEKAACRKNDVAYVEFLVANDGIAVVVNKQNTWAKCLAVDQLKKIWEPESKVNNWNQIETAFPDEKLRLFGPGTDSGTFDFFTDKIVGEEGSSRSDYSATEDDNVTVRGVAGEKGGLGYFGLSYFEQNRDELKDLEIDGGDGCVAPSRATVQAGTYKPLSRPLFIYAKKTSFERPEVRAFIRYIVDNERTIAEKALFVPLTKTQEQTAQRELSKAVAAVKSS